MQKLTDFIRKYPNWLSLSAGAGSATGFAPLNLWPITLLALALWMSILMDRDSKKSVFLSGWLFGLGHFVIGLNWIAKAFTFQAAMPEWLGYIAVVLVSLYLAIYPALAALGAWMVTHFRHPRESGDPAIAGVSSKLGSRLRGNDGLVFILALAGMWIVTEWLRSWMFSGFSWNPLGSVLITTSYSDAASWIGTYGISVFLFFLAGILAPFFAQSNDDSKGAILKEDLPILIAGGGFVIISFFILILVSNIAGYGADGSEKDDIMITVVQPNIGQQDKWKAGYEEENLSKLAKLTRREDAKPRIIFWPEAAIPDYLETGYPQRYYYGRPPELVRQQLASRMKPGDVLVLGALKLEFEDADANLGQRAVGARNSVFAMDANRELLGRYDKSHLVPYGEYLPMRSAMEAIGLSRLVPGDFDFWPGPGARSLDLGEFGKMGLQLCYEIIFSGQVVDRDDRPDFIFNPSNDAWFGAWGPPQHLAQARLRAIEEGLPVIRSTPTGISAVIDSNGAVKESVAMGVAGQIDTMLPASKSPTLFARYGNILPLGFALILLLSAIAIRVRAR